MYQCGLLAGGIVQQLFSSRWEREIAEAENHWWGRKARGTRLMERLEHTFSLEHTLPQGQCAMTNQWYPFFAYSQITCGLSELRKVFVFNTGNPRRYSLCVPGLSKYVVLVCTQVIRNALYAFFCMGAELLLPMRYVFWNTAESSTSKIDLGRERARRRRNQDLSGGRSSWHLTWLKWLIGHHQGKAHRE